MKDEYVPIKRPPHKISKATRSDVFNILKRPGGDSDLRRRLALSWGARAGYFISCLAVDNTMLLACETSGEGAETDEVRARGGERREGKRRERKGGEGKEGKGPRREGKKGASRPHSSPRMVSPSE